MDTELLSSKNWSTIRQEARAYAKAASLRVPNAFALAKKWYQHPAWQVRFFAVIVLGNIAAKKRAALDFLFEKCGDDSSWQVNEGLAMAFDDYCAGIGYEKSLPTIRQWLHAPRPNLRRAVSEGLRPWTATNRAYFAEHPQVAIDLLGILKDDDSRYVQESVGNALRDISRKHFALVLTALKEWLDAKPTSKSRRVIAEFALKNAVKSDPSLKKIYE